MAILPIRKYGDPVLRNPTADVTDFDEALRQLVNDMIDTMYAAPGVGLAANQVGVGKRLMIIDLSVGEEADALQVFINPKITRTEGEITEEEGCLSIPDFVEIVTRPKKLTVEFQDLDGSEQSLDAEGLMARAVCHEIDHLEGTLFIDYLRGLKKERILKKIKKLSRAGDW